MPAPGRPPRAAKVPNTSHHWPSTGRSSARDGASQPPHPPRPSNSHGGRLPSQPGCRLPAAQEDVWEAPGQNEPGTHWQWLEFYYYPIITLGSGPKWSVLPPWCHFLSSWLETKSRSMGAMHMMSLQFTAAASLSFSQSETHRKINSSQKWLKNA